MLMKVLRSFIDHPWLISALVVVVGLGIYGLRDLIRLSPRRMWAISGVCFRDAIRRRVLWITPLAMLGIVIVSQLQRPIDEADAIRITIKFCLFATALVVTIIALITAATNLPREIENRVIFTIVTKPVTRMEIAFGKLIGFARVSAAILLIMGLFSIGYLHLRAWYLQRQIVQNNEDVSAGALQRTPTHGLLFAQSIARPDNLQQFARFPTEDRRYILGGAQEAIADFKVPDGMAVMGIALQVPYERVAAPSADATATTAKAAPPELSVQVLDARTRNLVYSASALRSESPDEKPPAPLVLNDPQAKQPVLVDLPISRRQTLSGLGAFKLQIIGGSTEHLFAIGPGAVQLIVTADGKTMSMLPPVAPPQLRGSEGRSGQQLRGPEQGEQSVAIMQFRGVRHTAASEGKVPFELNAGVEATGNDTSDLGAEFDLEITVHDVAGDRTSPPVIVHPENRRTFFFSIPAEYLASGDFDVIMRNRSDAQTVELSQGSVAVVSSREYFGINLLKGLVVLWLFAILTAAVAFWCSTFLSWPIAVVLTLLIILCRWGVSNIDLQGGLSGVFTNDPTMRPATAHAIRAVVDGLSATLSGLANVLPDISAFSVTEQIERGISISMPQMFEPVSVLLLFGLPLMTLTYVFLRNKEVAP